MSGIWPPDPGGPASHAPALADFLAARGHAVEVVTTADCASRAARRIPVRWAARRSPLPAPARALLVRAAARRADVVYATSMIRRAALGARLARRPLVVKLVSDEVFERATRSGRYAGTLDEFQHWAAERVHALSGPTRNASAAARATRLLPERVPARRRARLGARSEARLGAAEPRAGGARRCRRARLCGTSWGSTGDVLVFAGRLGPQKALGVALEALAAVADVTLVVAGDGPEREALERRAAELGLDGRVRFLGSVPRERVLRLFRAADASVLPSAWENFPHTVVEALAVGCPVIATAVGGVPEVVRDGENGLLVPPDDCRGARGGDRALLRGDAELRARLSRGGAADRSPATPRRPSSARSRPSSRGRRA